MLLAQYTSDTSSGSSGVNVGLIIGIYVVVYLLSAFAFYGIFKKAGQPVWGAFVPIVNIYFLLKTVGRPGWWLILFLIPCVSFVIWIVIAYDLARSFGHGVGMTLGLIFLSLIFLYVIGYGSSPYAGPMGAPGATGTLPPPSAGAM
jgi:hypothetical protein